MRFVVRAVDLLAVAWLGKQAVDVYKNARDRRLIRQDQRVNSPGGTA